jgi:PAP2 superfamily
MKNAFNKIIALILIFSFVQNACNKDVEITGLEPQVAATTDATGGTWKPFILTEAKEIAVAAPLDATTSDYKAELAAVKNAVANATAEQKAAAKYWAAGAVYRWHEMAREIAANYNVPPKFNEEKGAYIFPDANNPSALPKFPFANPPYTARALALLSVAQYDALVATWHYKAQYKRLTPAKYDAAITPSVPVLDLPSYPSEDAVVAAASREILKAMFPNETAIWTAKAEEHKNSRLWVGANVASDLAAGDELGKAVAAKVMAYARADGMSGANAQANFPNLVADAKSRGITELWSSIEIPARPPLLPFYGTVKTWNMTKPDMVALRPAAPPKIGSAEFEKDLAEMRELAKNRTKEQFNIANYWADGLGSYTPPGHWDRIAADLTRSNRFNELRTARTMALVNTAIQDAGISCWDTKYYYLTPRPTTVDRSITTSTGIPNFPGYTSGHSTFSGAAATVLAAIFPNEATSLNAKAKEASESRIYGCIHFRHDCEIGLKVGNSIGNYAIQRGKKDGSGL